MEYPMLLSQGKIGTLTTKNKVVMTAMGVGLADTDGSATDAFIAFYEARARGGAGLIITEVTMVNGEHGRHNPNQIGAFADRHIPGLSALSETVHQYDCRIFLQLYHPGNQTFCHLVGGPLRTPSGISSGVLHQDARAMTVQEIHQLVDDFACAAFRAQQAGIDGVELHAAHGYLLNEFLSPYTNKREDEYGGTIKNRCRIIQEIILAVKRKVGPDYPVTLRISVDEFLEMSPIKEEGLGLPEGVAAAAYLEQFGIDAISVSCGIYDTQNTAWEPIAYKQGWRTYLAKAVKEKVSVPVFSVAVYRDPEFMEDVLQQGSADFVGIARGLLAEPEWVNKVVAGKEDEIRPCISCLHCMESLSFHNRTECAVNACSHHELEYGELIRNGDRRTVAVVGSGPAGMEAARVLALRGYKPVLFERHSQLGGQLYYATKPPHKEKIAKLIAYYKRQFELLDVEIRLNCAATLENIRALDPYAVLVGAGSTPIVPRSIPGIDSKNVCTAVDILTGDVSFTGKSVSVIGSGMTGLETAELLAEQGNTVSIVEMADDLGPGAYIQNLLDLLQKLHGYDVRLMPGHKLVRIAEDSVLLQRTSDGSTIQHAAQRIVLSMGVKTETELRDELIANLPRVYPIGDSIKVGRIANAVRTGYEQAAAL